VLHVERDALLVAVQGEEVAAVHARFVRAPAWIALALWSELRRQFSEAEIIELVAHTTLYIGFGRFNEIIGPA
jgi:hypothetical protein